MNHVGTERETQAIDLSEARVAAFLARIGPAASVLVDMERIESWPCPEDADLERELATFCLHFDEGMLQEMVLAGDPRILEILTYLRATRSVLMLEQLSDAVAVFDVSPTDILVNMSERAVGDQAMEASLQATAGRLLHLDRMQVLRRVYGGGRAAQMLKVVNEVLNL